MNTRHFLNQSFYNMAFFGVQDFSGYYPRNENRSWCKAIMGTVERQCLHPSNKISQAKSCFPSGTMLCNLDFINMLSPVQAAARESLKAAESKSAPHQDAVAPDCVLFLGIEKSSAHKTIQTSRQEWEFSIANISRVLLTKDHICQILTGKKLLISSGGWWKRKEHFIFRSQTTMPTLQKLSIPSAHWLPSFVPVTRFKSSYTGNWYGEMRKRKMFIHRNRRTERQD